MTEQTLTDFITVKLDEIQEIRDALTAKSRSVLQEAFARFFELHPQVKTIHWRQWIPGFNDGDPCEFSIGDICFSPVDLDEITSPYFDDEDEDPERESFKGFNGTKPGLDAQFVEDMRAVERMIYNESDTIEFLYGSNSFIRIGNDRYEVEDYDCGY